MAITRTQNIGAQTGQGSSKSFSFSTLPSVNNCILVFVTTWVATTTEPNITVSDNQGGSAYTRAAIVSNFVDGGSFYKQEVFYRANISAPSGTFTITVNSNNGGTYFVCGAAAFSGCATSSPIRATATDKRTTVTSTDANITSNAAVGGDLLLVSASLANSSSTAIGSPSSGYTQIASYDDYSAYGSLSAYYKIVESSGAVSASWNHWDNRWGAILVLVKPIATTKVRLMSGGD